MLGVHPDEFGVRDEVADGFHEVGEGLALARDIGVDSIEVALKGRHQAFIFLNLVVFAV